MSLKQQLNTTDQLSKTLSDQIDWIFSCSDLIRNQVHGRGFLLKGQPSEIIMPKSTIRNNYAIYAKICLKMQKMIFYARYAI